MAALGSTPEETAPTASSSALDALFAGGGNAPPSGAEAVPEELEYDEEALVIGLEDLPGVTPEVADRLVEAGLDQTEAMLEAGVEGLARIEGLDEEMARQILVILEGGEI